LSDRIISLEREIRLYSEFVKLLTVKGTQRTSRGVYAFRFLSLGALLGCALALIGCGGGAAADPPIAPANVTLLVQDAPAAGIAEFNIDVTGATLKASGGQSLTLSTTPTTLEIRHLGLSPTVALRGSATQTNSYSSLLLSFANPQLTIVDAQGKTKRITGQGTPSVRLTGGSVSLPLTATVGAADHLGVMLDFDLQHSVSTDANGNYVIKPVVQAKVLSSAAQIGLDGTLAVVSGLYFNGPNVLSQVPISTLGQGGPAPQVFQAQLLDSSQSVAVTVDSSTILDAAIGQFSNLHLGQVIYLSANFQNDGTFLAKSIGTGPASLSQRYQGLVTGVHQNSSGQPAFDVVVQN
jgi:Domain of unknown function (DUF4382)